MRVCCVCGNEAKEEHHISYFPEKKIDVCCPCHQEIHHSKKFKNLQPLVGDCYKFYGYFACFNITPEQRKRIDMLPKSFNLSEAMRTSLEEILYKAGNS